MHGNFPIFVSFVSAGHDIRSTLPPLNECIEVIIFMDERDDLLVALQHVWKLPDFCFLRSAGLGIRFTLIPVNERVEFIIALAERDDLLGCITAWMKILVSSLCSTHLTHEILSACLVFNWQH